MHTPLSVLMLLRLSELPFQHQFILIYFLIRKLQCIYVLHRVKWFKKYHILTL